MDLTHLADEIADIRKQIQDSIAGVALDEYQQNAFAFVSQRLEQMESECRTGSLKPADKRYPELGRIAAETDPALLSPDLGGKMMEVEKKYQNA